MYVYQGEELGLPEVEDIPDAPPPGPDVARARAASIPGRDGCRVPIPWSGSRPPYGFSPDGAPPWLDQPGGLGRADRRGAGAATRVDAQPLPRRPAPAACRAVGRRRGGLSWLPRPRRARVRRAASASSASSTSAPTRFRSRTAPSVLIASDELEGGAVPPDTTVWLRRPARPRQVKERKDDEVHARCITAVAVAGLLAVCATAARRVGSTTKTVTISVASLIPGSTHAAVAAVQRAGRASSRRRTRRSRSSRSSTSGPGRRSPRSSPPARCRRSSRCRSPTPGRSATTASSPT